MQCFEGAGQALHGTDVGKIFHNSTCTQCSKQAWCTPSWWDLHWHCLHDSDIAARGSTIQPHRRLVTCIDAYPAGTLCWALKNCFASSSSFWGAHGGQEAPFFSYLCPLVRFSVGKSLCISTAKEPGIASTKVLLRMQVLLQLGQTGCELLAFAHAWLLLASYCSWSPMPTSP